MKVADPTYSFNGKNYDLRMTYGYVIKTLINFEVDLTKLFEGSNIDDLLQRMLLNDDLALKLWWSHVQKDFGTDGYDKAVDLLTGPLLQEFKEAWWGAVTDFFDPLRRGILVELLGQAERMVRKQVDSALKNLDSGS